MNKPTLFVARGNLLSEQAKALSALGYHVCYVNSVDGVKTVGEVPLRDYFAAAALQGLLASPRSPMKAGVVPSVVTDTLLASLSYAIADAMLAEREKAPE